MFTFRTGAVRLELCSCLDVGGITPSIGLLKHVKDVIKIPTFVLIRARPSDFLNTDAEIDLMVTDIQMAKQNGADGFVFGVLTEDGYVDEVKTKQLLSACHPLPATFHRAIDMCQNPLEAIKILGKLGFQRILTSGQMGNAYDGRFFIQAMNEAAKDNITIMPGGGITEENLKEIITGTACTEFHASARCQVESRMKYRNQNVTMGRTSQEYQHFVCSANKVENLTKIVNSLANALGGK